MIRKQLFPQIYMLEIIVSEVARSLRRGYSLSLVALHVDLSSDLSAERRTQAHQAVAAHLLERVRLSDYVSRFQGDTYFVLMPETSDIAAPLVEERVKEGLSEILAGLAEVRTARRTYAWQSTKELPDLSELQADLKALLDEVDGSQAQVVAVRR